MSDQYWISAIISQNQINQTQGIRYNSDTNRYQIDISNENKYLAKNEVLVDKVIVFLGVKNLDLLTNITNKYNIDRFEKTIDFGVFYFISKPMLVILKKLYNISQNFGIAIILLTILVRLIIFPLAHRSYKAAADIKKISPKLKVLQEQYKDDRKALQMATYDLYKQEKINPASAIFPMLLQIPIFFALYKVLTISIEMRDAPFLWIKDLSAKDPTSFINAFGLLPFEAPSFLQIGALPCLMGLTMFIQQKMTPTMVVDKAQKRMMSLMPVIFLLMFSGMPAGLVLYWTFSNVFTIIQQAFILKLNGTSVSNTDFNDGIDSLKKKNEAIKYIERIKHKYHK
jgi:YidC/Oxa1 family membrane protein insertase